MHHTRLLSVPLLMLAACGKDVPDPTDITDHADDTADTNPTDGTTVETVGAEGGELALAGGATLEIPAGALSEDVEITATIITDLAGWAEAPSFADEVRFAVSLEPHGTLFAMPATLKLPHGGWDDRLAVMRTSDPSDTTWEVVAGMEEDGDAASVLIDGFSGYSLVVVKDGSCPCFDGADVAAFNRYGKSRGWDSLLRVDTSSKPSLYVDHSFYDSERNAYINRKDDVCWARVMHTNGGLEAPELFDAFFPGLTPDYEGATAYYSDSYVNRPVTTDEASACDTLILAGAKGVLGLSLEVRVDGLGTGAATLTKSGVFLATLAEGTQAVGDFAPDGSVDLGLSGVSAGQSCTFDANGTTKATVAVADGPVAVTCAPVVPTTTTTTYSGPMATGVDTPTATTVDLDVADPGTITDIDVQLHLVDGNGYAREMEINLIHDGVTVRVHDRVDDPAVPPFVAAVINATFDDEAADAIPAPPADRGTGVTVDVIGTYRPYEPLSAFDGQALAGMWTLSFADVGAWPNDGENLASWSVVATTESTAAECPCWDASVFASSTFTSCRTEDYVPNGAPDGVDDYYGLGSSSSDHVVGTNNDPMNEFLFCKGRNPSVAQGYLTAEEHAACMDLVQAAMRDSGLTCL